MYDYSSDSSVLSVIARGRGLLEGGVELDCINTETAFSLSVSHRLTYIDQYSAMPEIIPSLISIFKLKIFSDTGSIKLLSEPNPLQQVCIFMYKTLKPLIAFSEALLARLLAIRNRLYNVIDL